jgi:glutathionyl-hydroquinone reductase
MPNRYKFKKGNYLILTDSEHFAAEVGAMAIVTREYNLLEPTIEVEWICETYQQNGAYFPGSFRAATKEEIEGHLSKHVNPE